MGWFWFPYKVHLLGEITSSTVSKSLFEIVYGCHARGIVELIDIGEIEKMSALGETFAKNIK